MDVLPDIQVSNVVLRKLLHVKNLRLHVIDNHSRDFLASNCARVSIKLGKATRSKRQLLKLSKTNGKSAKHRYLLNNLRSCPAAAQGRQSLWGLPHIGRLSPHQEGCFNWRRPFQSCLISVDSGLDIMVERICWPIGFNCDAQLSSPHWGTVELLSGSAPSPQQGELYRRGLLV